MFFHRVPAIVTDDDVIKHFDLENFPRLDNPTGDRNVIVAWVRITAWVIMKKDDRGTILADSLLENFSNPDLR